MELDEPGENSGKEAWHRRVLDTPGRTQVIVVRPQCPLGCPVCIYHRGDFSLDRMCSQAEGQLSGQLTCGTYPCPE